MQIKPESFWFTYNTCKTKLFSLFRKISRTLKGASSKWIKKELYIHAESLCDQTDSLRNKQFLLDLVHVLCTFEKVKKGPFIWPKIYFSTVYNTWNKVRRNFLFLWESVSECIYAIKVFCPICWTAALNLQNVSASHMFFLSHYHNQDYITCSCDCLNRGCAASLFSVQSACSISMPLQTVPPPHNAIPVFQPISDEQVLSPPPPQYETYLCPHPPQYETCHVLCVSCVILKNGACSQLSTVHNLATCCYTKIMRRKFRSRIVGGGGGRTEAGLVLWGGGTKLARRWLAEKSGIVLWGGGGGTVWTGIEIKHRVWREERSCAASVPSFVSWYRKCSLATTQNMRKMTFI